MNYGSFNWHEIKFTLATHNTPEDKLSYLYKLKLDVNKVILCFEKPKTLPLQMYADPNTIADDGCDELMFFLKNKIENFDLDPYQTHQPTEDSLAGDVKKEVMNYLELSKLIDSEIEFYNKERDKVEEEPKEKKSLLKKEELEEEKKTLKLKIDNNVLQKNVKEAVPKKEEKIELKFDGEKRVITEENNENVIVDLQDEEKVDENLVSDEDLQKLEKDLDDKEALSIKENKELIANIKKEIDDEVKTLSEELETETERQIDKINEDKSEENDDPLKIAWKGSAEELHKFFGLLLKEDLISFDKYEERYQFISKYVTDENGKTYEEDDDLVDDDEGDKANWQKGYKRYSKIFDRFKS